VDGLDEVDVIHGGGDDVGARVSIGSDGAGEINEVHEAPAEEIAEGIGVVGEDNLGHFGLGACNGSHLRTGFSGTHDFDLLHLSGYRLPTTGASVEVHFELQ
jgi:hypothetical protein